MPAGKASELNLVDFDIIIILDRWFKVAIAGFYVAVARQIGYLKFFPFFFLECDQFFFPPFICLRLFRELFLQSRSKEIMIS